LGGGFILQYRGPFFLYKFMAMICCLSLLIILVLKYKEKQVLLKA
jgi:hypothetical protein